MGKFLKIGFLILLLIAVRAFGVHLFYDPFIGYFKRFVYSPALPEYDTLKLIFNVAIRYLLNTLISLSLLYVVFKNKAILKFAGIFYSIAFVLLLTAFVPLLLNLKPNSVMPFFYVRRFLIHPIFILLLLPAFYYQKMMKE